jgi:hypothetical protein
VSATSDNLLLRRLLFAVVFALIACGMTFYLCLCLGIMADLVLRGWNPANSTVLQSALKNLAFPLSVVAAAVVFAVTARGSSIRR